MRHGHQRTVTLMLAVGAVATIAAGPGASMAEPRKANVAHRGASAYAPEHTLAAYELAIAQGADFVEQDLAVTRDGVLICLHDASLERTTDVEQRFPDRFTRQVFRGQTRKVWLANDFTLAEIKTLDAGSWFGATFAGQRVPTFDEAVALVRGRAGLYPELKTPEIYEGRNVDFVALVAQALDRLHLRGPAADPRTPVILQTFGPSTARALAARRLGLPIVLLIDPGTGPWDSQAVVNDWKGVVTGFGPAKSVVSAHPEFVGLAHAAGMTVTPYTFTTREGAPAAVTAEMANMLYRLGVDALFTDNPDLFPRRP